MYISPAHEDFREVNIQRYFGLGQYITQVLEVSQLEKLGIIDAAPLRTLHSNALQTGHIDPLLALLFVRLLYAELNLRSLGIHA